MEILLVLWRLAWRLNGAIGLLVMLVLSSLVQAQSSSQPLPSLKIDEVAPTTQTSTLKADSFLENKKFDEYEGITDTRMRASGGSLSRYSMKFDLSYGGPAIDNLSSKDQPNPQNLNRPTETNMTGTMGMRVRLSSQTGVGLGTGLRDNYPIQGGSTYDLSTPFLGIDHGARVGDFQIMQSLRTSRATMPTSTAVGEEGSVGYGISTVHDLGTTPISLSADANAGYTFFNRPYSPRLDGKRKVMEGDLASSFGIKYLINSRSEISTGLRFCWDSPRYHPGQTLTRIDLDPEDISQSLGYSYALTRDVLIFPFIRFYPTKMAMDTSTVNVGTVFSIF